MDFWKFLNDNLWTLIFIFIVFGGSIVTGFQWIIKHWTAHRERMAKILAGGKDRHLERLEKRIADLERPHVKYEHAEEYSLYSEGLQQLPPM